jgi:hypothetical protein
MRTERRTGSLERGKFADYIVVAQDPMKVRARAISETKVLRAIDDPLERLAAFVAAYLPDDRHDPVWKLWIEGWLRSPSRTEFVPIGKQADQGWMADAIECVDPDAAAGHAMAALRSELR